MSAPIGSSSFRLAWGNYCFDDELTTSIEGVASASLVVSDIDNSQSPQLSDRATVSGTGTTGIQWNGDPAGFADTDDNAAIDVVGLLNFDAELSGGAAQSWRVVIKNNSAVTVYDSGWVPLVHPPNDGFPHHQWLILPARVYGVDVTWSFNELDSGSTVLRVGAVWVSQLWHTERGIEDDFFYEPIDSGEMGLSKGRQGYPSDGVRGQAFEFTLARFSQIEAFGNPADPTFVDVQKLQHTVGKTGFVIAWARTKVDGVLSPHLIHRMGVYGSFTQLGRISHVAGDDYKAGSMRVESLA